MRRLLAGLVLTAALVSAQSALASPAQERALAERYAPVVQLAAHGGCGPGVPYLPIDVNALFDEPTVALRGPWGGGDLVKIAPTAADLGRGLFEYHLDFPGSALEPGCSYVHWERHIVAGHAPAVYAHVAHDREYPGKLALQYWLFYVFNDWNNLHEGDWEMIQLVFDASTPAQALQRAPVEVGYSQHEGAERAGWDDAKLERIDGTHPVVHPAAGSHANFYGEALFLGRSAQQGVGCDDTRDPILTLRPAVHTIPSDPALARAEYPWIAFQGRWGELRPRFFNGPEGPNLKQQWTEPIQWAQSWRPRSYSVPVGSAFGTSATDFFCSAVGGGSRALVQLVNRPLEFAWGQILSASARMYLWRAPLFFAIGVLFVPISLLVTLLQTLALHGTSILGVQTGGDSSGIVGFVVLTLGTALTLLGLGVVQAACARALVDLDDGHPIGPVTAYRRAFDALAPLFGALVIASLVVSLLVSTFYLLPVGIWLAGRWALIAPVIELEDASPFEALRRSGQLVRRRWLKVASIIVAGAAIVLVAGPLLGALLLFATSAPFWLVNVVAGIVYAVAMPFVGLTTVYAYADARARVGLEQEHGTVLPAEVELAPEGA
jgi:hypothetical protein